LQTVIAWFLFPLVASILLLAITNEVCQDVAVIPFLWVVPLSLYLLSFILCFGGSVFYKRWLFIPLAVASLFCIHKTSLVVLPEDSDIRFDIVFWFTSLFVYCMVCHGELHRRKPDPKHLTLYYLLISLGGVGGGIFVGLI